MRKLMWIVCVCGLMLPGVARAEFWTEDFDTDLSHWTQTGGAISLDGGRMKLQADGYCQAEADYPVSWPAEGEVSMLTFGGMRSPGQNATANLGAVPDGRIQFWYADVQEPNGYFRARLENVYVGGTGCPVPGGDTSLGTTEDELDLRFVFTGLPGDEVQIDWQWKLSADDEFIPVECGTATIAKADYPDVTVHFGAQNRGGDNATWFVDSVSFVPEPATIGLLVFAAPMLLRLRRKA